VPYAEGYVPRQLTSDRVLTREPNEAWSCQVPLYVDHSPLTFDQYSLIASEPNPWANDRYLMRTIGPFWKSTPSKVIGEWEKYAEARSLLDIEGKRPPQPVVYRALGTLPTPALLDSDNYTYDLRIDPMLHNVKGEPADSCRSYNYSNIKDEYDCDLVFTFGSPYYVGGIQRHVPSYEVKRPGFYGPDDKATSWEMSPNDFHCALFLPEYKTDGNPAYLVIHLAGATAVAEATD